MRRRFELKRSDKFISESCDRINRPIVFADSAFAKPWKVRDDKTDVRQSGNDVLEAFVATGETMDKYHGNLSFWMVGPVADSRRFIEAYGLFHGLTLHHALMFAVLITLFDGLALIIKLLAFTECNDKLDIFTCCQELGRDDCHPLFATSGKRVNLLA